MALLFVPTVYATDAWMNHSRALWFDPLAFQRVTCQNLNRPDLCHYGNSGRNIMDSPGQRNLDFSLFKNFSITERTENAGPRRSIQRLQYAFLRPAE